MTDQEKCPNISPSRRRVQISPERYGSTTYKNLSYTPQKLQNSYMYKEVTINKKVETEKNVIREFQSLNALLEDKIGHLTLQNHTMRTGYQKHIQMYKRMLREQEQQTKRLIKSLQLQYTLEIQKVLQSHEQDSKVAQAQKQELQYRIQQLLSRILQLQGHINHGTNTINDLTSQLNLTSQKLLNTESKLQQSKEDGRRNIDRLNNEIHNLSNKIIQNQITFKQQLESLNASKNKQIDSLNRFHLTELDKIDAKRDAELKSKNLQMQDIKATFDRQTLRLEDIINNKDRVNQTLALQLRKEKERVAALTRNYDLQIGKLVSQKDHILSDLAAISQEKIIIEKQLYDMGLLFDAQRGRNAAVVNTLQGQIEMKNISLVKENEKLLRAINQYEKELALVSHSANTVNKTIQIQRSEQVRRLVLQIRNLKQILLQSSTQMDKCKAQFLRLENQKDQLIQINRECQSQAIRLRSLISQQDLQLRLRRI